LRVNPSATAATTELARLQLAKGRTEASANLAREALKGQPQNLDAGLLLVRSLIASRDVSGSEEQLRGLVAKYPNSAAVQCLVGRVALLRNDDAKAKAAFQRALAIEPASDEALTGMLTVDMRQKQPAAAKARIESALKSQPTNGTILALAAGVYTSLGDLPSA